MLGLLSSWVGVTFATGDLASQCIRGKRDRQGSQWGSPGPTGTLHGLLGHAGVGRSEKAPEKVTSKRRAEGQKEEAGGAGRGTSPAEPKGTEEGPLGRACRWWSWGWRDK